MAVDVKKCLVELGRMTVPELRERYAEVFGESTGSRHKQHLIRRIVWRLQALEEGGLSERSIRRAKELVCEADLRLQAPHRYRDRKGDGSDIVVEAPFQVEADMRLPMPGALLRRQYKGRMLHVRVLNSGFEFEGEVHRSLSAIAKKVTGSHWNGFAFFGLTGGKREAKR